MVVVVVVDEDDGMSIFGVNVGFSAFLFCVCKKKVKCAKLSQRVRICSEDTSTGSTFFLCVRVEMRFKSKFNVYYTCMWEKRKQNIKRGVLVFVFFSSLVVPRT